jgi:hypothetical protein
MDSCNDFEGFFGNVEDWQSVTSDLARAEAGWDLLIWTLVVAFEGRVSDVEISVGVPLLGRGRSTK